MDDDLAACVEHRRAAQSVVAPGAEGPRESPPPLVIRGPRALVGRARAVGDLGPIELIPPCAGPGWTAWWAVHRAWRRAARPTVVRCWGNAAVDAARLLPAHVERRWMSPHAEPLDPDAWPDADRAARPPPSHADASDPAPTTIALLGRAPEADAMRFAFLISLLSRAGLRVAGRVGDAAGELPRARRWLRRQALQVHVALSRRTGAELIAGCHAAVWVGRGDGPMRPGPIEPGEANRAARACLSLGVACVVPAAAVRLAGKTHPPGLHLASNASLAELARVLLAVLEPAGAPRHAGPAPTSLASAPAVEAAR